MEWPFQSGRAWSHLWSRRRSRQCFGVKHINRRSQHLGVAVCSPSSVVQRRETAMDRRRLLKLTSVALAGAAAIPTVAHRVVSPDLAFNRPPCRWGLNVCPVAVAAHSRSTSSR